MKVTLHEIYITQVQVLTRIFAKGAIVSFMFLLHLNLVFFFQFSLFKQQLKYNSVTFSTLAKHKIMIKAPNPNLFTIKIYRTEEENFYGTKAKITSLLESGSYN